MRRQTIRSLASIMIWVGGVELFASFLTKMLFDYVIPFSQVFIAMLLIGFATWIISTAFFRP
ncbi:hypothetical protein EV586_1104 [Tumebacillus sp. BK434]|uniref:Uncharacterized protein n=1 Tax=Tumebacillus avium TaxID=1903704 RepID=A0A1Y0ISI5_9BACL|nr:MULTISPECIES: hypothetical protein [Tumebacillus]ARU62333.1 hypothetical protein CBW65_16210 [Tumebacillus avium]TCP52405.1 hypothetical protein EV586_1104 [Tumebacillus sp. BK434]